MPAPTFINPLLETNLDKYANRTDELLYELLYNIQNGGLGGGATPPAGSNTQIQFNNAGAFGASSDFVWDNTNSRLGIGVTPTQALSVNGNISVGQSNQFIINNTNVGIGRTSNDLYLGGFGAIRFKSSNTSIDLQTTRMSITSSGDVGINQLIPTARLEVKGSGTTSATTALLLQNLSSLQLLKVGDDASVTIGGGSRTGYLEINGTASLQLRTRDLSNGFYTDYTNNSIGFFGDATRTFEIRTGTGSYDTIARWSDLGDFNLYNTSYTPLFTALSTGEIGAGTETPISGLVGVSGPLIQIVNATYPIVYYNSTSVEAYTGVFNDADFTAGTRTNHPVNLITNTNIRFTINGSGSIRMSPQPLYGTHLYDVQIDGNLASDYLNVRKNALPSTLRKGDIYMNGDHLFFYNGTTSIQLD